MANAAHSRQDPAKGAGVLALEREAHGLADRLPEILIDAQRIAQTVAHGLHGRRRAGPGETFWQFRQFQASDTLRQIDWRRSASSDHLYVREREWEAAHTVWLWPDLSAFDELPQPPRHDDQARPCRAPDAGRGRAARARRRARCHARPDAADRQPQGDDAHRRSDPRPRRLARRLSATQPPKVHLARFSGAVLFSDFLDPIAQDARARRSSRRRWRRRPPHRDRRSGRRDAPLRGPHRIPQPRRRPTLGRRPRAKPARAIQASASKRTAPS